MPDSVLDRVLARSPDFRARLVGALAVVQRALGECQRPYVAFSGGVDSLAVLALVQAVHPTVAAAWSDDELELPETVTMMEQLQAVAPSAGTDFRVTLGWAEHAGWFRPWQDNPPFRPPLPGAVAINMGQDEWMAAEGFDFVFPGVRMDENRRRQAWLAGHGPLYRVRTGTGWRCCPLWDWSKDEVWALVAHWGLPYNPAYDRMEELGIPRRMQRVGPLPLAPRSQLEAGWPDLLAQLEARYGPHWR